MKEFIISVLKAFLIGGSICTVGQLLIDFTSLTPPKILTSFVVAGVILGGLGIYEPFLEFAGAGASVPLLGFGSTLAQGVKAAVKEKGLIGIFTGGLAGTAAGITAAVISALLVSFLFDPSDKK